MTWRTSYSADTPEAKSSDEAEAENVDEAISVADFSGTLASLPLQDVVLAEDTPIASDEPSGSTMADVIEPAFTTLDKPLAEDMGLPRL